MIKCTLDDDGCMGLMAILGVMNQLDQEQAWALAYELAALMQRLSPASKCATIESLAQIYIHRDGYIHQKSLSLSNDTNATATSCNNNNGTNSTTTTTTTNNNNNNNTKQHQNNTSSATISQTSPQSQQHHNHHHHQQPLPPTPPITPELNDHLLRERRPALDESELVASLGLALFWALDYGIPDDEERKLSIAMEYLIIQSQSKLSLVELLDICIKRLPNSTKSYADQYYRGICKSLIEDTIELSIFLDKIYTASMVLSDITTTDHLDVVCLEPTSDSKNQHDRRALDCDMRISNNINDPLSELGLPIASLRALRFNDWARLWMQVIRELRQRSKFKQ